MSQFAMTQFKFKCFISQKIHKIHKHCMGNQQHAKLSALWAHSRPFNHQWLREAVVILSGNCPMRYIRFKLEENPWKTFHLRHDDHDGVSNHQPQGCFLHRLFRRRSKKAQKLRVTGLCVRNWPGPRTKGQLRGKCFHLMTSSCYSSLGFMLCMLDIHYIK